MHITVVIFSIQLKTGLRMGSSFLSGVGYQLGMQFALFSKTDWMRATIL